MNRQIEYETLIKELSVAPKELNTIVIENQKKANKKKTLRLFKIPAAIAASLLLVFATLVNISPAFAEAVDKIPFLKELAKSVNLSPEMEQEVTNAIEEDRIVNLGLSQTKNGITINLEYAAMDDEGIHIFYTYTCNKKGDGNLVISDRKVKPRMRLYGSEHTEGGPNSGTLFAEIFPSLKNGTQPEQDVPPFIDLDLMVYFDNQEYRVAQHDNRSGEGTKSLDKSQNGETVYTEGYLADFQFQVPTAGLEKAPAKEVKINREFTVKGNGFTVETVKIIPDSTKVKIWTDNEKNNKDILEMDISIEVGGEILKRPVPPYGINDEDGTPVEPDFEIERLNYRYFSFEDIGEVDLEGIYFKEAKEFTIRIEKIKLQEKQEKFAKEDQEAYINDDWEVKEKYCEVIDTNFEIHVKVP